MQCAKVELPSEIIILSTTESKYHFLGTIIPRVSVMSIDSISHIYLSVLNFKFSHMMDLNSCAFL